MYLNLEHLRQRGGKHCEDNNGKVETGSSVSRHLHRRLCACWQTELHSESEFYSESIKASVLSVFYMHYIVQCNQHLVHLKKAKTMSIASSLC